MAKAKQKFEKVNNVISIRIPTVYVQQANAEEYVQWAQQCCQKLAELNAKNYYETEVLKENSFYSKDVSNLIHVVKPINKLSELSQLSQVSISEIEKAVKLKSTDNELFYFTSDRTDIVELFKEKTDEDL